MERQHLMQWECGVIERRERKRYSEWDRMSSWRGRQTEGIFCKRRQKREWERFLGVWLGHRKMNMGGEDMSSQCCKNIYSSLGSHFKVWATAWAN